MTDNWTEPRIIIGDTTLNKFQAMTLRVAINGLMGEMYAVGLGDDEHGRNMATGYVESCRQMNKLIFKSIDFQKEKEENNERKYGSTNETI